jgi:hypothetical protein
MDTTHGLGRAVVLDSHHSLQQGVWHAVLSRQPELNGAAEQQQYTLRAAPTFLLRVRAAGLHAGCSQH